MIELLTDIDKSAGASFVELSWFVGQADLHYARDVSRWSLNSDCMAGDQLTPDGDGPEDDLHPVKEVLSDDDDGLTASSPSLTGRDRLDLRDQGADGVEASVGAVQPPDFAPVLAVVVDEHVLAEAEQGAGVHVESGGDGHLEASHVPGVAGILEAVLIALQKEFQLEPANSITEFKTSDSLDSKLLIFNAAFELLTSKVDYFWANIELFRIPSCQSYC